MHGEAAYFVDDILGIVTEEIGAFLDEPFGSKSCPGFLVGDSHKDHVPIDRNSLADEFSEGSEGHRRKSLHVDRAATPDAGAVVMSGERRMRPARRVGRHDVDVATQDERTSGALRRISGESCYEIGTFLVGTDDLRFQSQTAAAFRNKGNRGSLVSRRIARVELNQLLQEG